MQYSIEAASADGLLRATRGTLMACLSRLTFHLFDDALDVGNVFTHRSIALARHACAALTASKLLALSVVGMVLAYPSEAAADFTFRICHRRSSGRAPVGLERACVGGVTSSVSPIRPLWDHLHGPQPCPRAGAFS
jgi:hypothetical protein